MEEFNNIYMPCWDCPYGHSCKYYQDSLWDQWIVYTRCCPVYYYPFNYIYNNAKNKKAKINSIVKNF